MLTSIHLDVSELYDMLTCINFLILAQSFSGILPNRQKGPAMEKSLQASSTEWKERVWVLPANLCSPVRPETAETCMGRWRTQTEVDCETGEGISMIPTLKIMFVENKPHANAQYIEITHKLPVYFLNSFKIIVLRIILLLLKNVVNLTDFFGKGCYEFIILCCYWMNISIVTEGNNSCFQCYDKKINLRKLRQGFSFCHIHKFPLNQ